MEKPKQTLWPTQQNQSLANLIEPIIGQMVCVPASQNVYGDGPGFQSQSFVKYKIT